MNADLFYVVDAPKAIPLYLLSQAQWQETQYSFSTKERNYFAIRQFKGALGELCCMHNADGLIEKAFIGTGTHLIPQSLAMAASSLPSGCYELQENVNASAAIFWALAQYRFSDYKKTTGMPRQLVRSPAEKKELTSVVDAVFLVRDLINKPTNDMGPEELAHVMQRLAGTHDAYFEQWIDEELLEHRFPAIHAVGRASIHRPRLLSLTWGNPLHPKVILVGKGVCFDTGGLDIKSSGAMRYMKKDMAGAAHAIGLAQWIMEQQLPIHLHVLIPAVENAVGPDAFRPGDIITMRNGLTVEIDNTDAEGRLVLADALVKACEEKPELVIDFSTLTGAARIAVGTEISALFCNDDAIANEITHLSIAQRDPVWRMPLFAEYEDMLNSSIADLVNCSTSSYAGAITAGLFLQRFISNDVTWLHFDLMGWNVGSKPGKPEGGEAMSLRVMAEILAKRYR